MDVNFEHLSLTLQMFLLLSLKRQIFACIKRILLNSLITNLQWILSGHEKDCVVNTLCSVVTLALYSFFPPSIDFCLWYGGPSKTGRSNVLPVSSPNFGMFTNRSWIRFSKTKITITITKTQSCFYFSRNLFG